jgi:outer membrane receptor protein involved in Fe transport
VYGETKGFLPPPSGRGAGGEGRRYTRKFLLHYLFLIPKCCFSLTDFLITKTKEDINGTDVGLRVGSFNTQDAWLLHGGSYQGFNLAVALEYHDTEGPQQIIESDVQTYYDNLFKTHASLAPGPVTLPRRNWDARLEVSQGNWQGRLGYQGRHNWGIGTSVAQALDPVGRYVSDRLNADLTYHNPQFASHWDVTAQLSGLDTAFQVTRNQFLFPPGAFGGAYPNGFIGNTGVSERHTRLDLSGFYSGFEKHTVRLGTGYRYGDVYKVTGVANFGPDPTTGQPLPPGSGLIDITDTSAIFLPEKVRKLGYVFLQDAYQFATDWELTAGLRYDQYSDFGSTVNPRLALVWKTRPDLTCKFLYGRAFRAPAFYELYQINNPVVLGNPNLKPETLEMWELALDYQPQKNWHLIGI